VSFKVSIQLWKKIHFSYFDLDYPTDGLTATGLAGVYWNKVTVELHATAHSVLFFPLQTVANYIGATRTLEYVPETKIYWAGGRTDPPPDTPTCGFDNSLCPDNCK
jgi:hypothetical protein